jgi:Uma2 family endonuclease
MAVDIAPERRRFTIKEYEKMVETGILVRDDRVELIDGEIIEMSPMGDPHVGCVINLNHLLVRGVGERARVQVQGPVRIPPRSVPEPDVAILRPRSYRREGATPADVLLVIEVADTSLLYDRTVKLRLYARAGILEYWLVDANAETIDVYRSPSGDGYAEHRQLTRGNTVAPLAFRDLVITMESVFV